MKNIVICMLLAVISGSCSQVLEEPFAAYTFSEDEKTFQDKYIQDLYYEGVGGTHNYYSYIAAPNNPIEHPLILVTGLEDIVENWWPTVKKALSDGYQEIYIYEIRGQGRSDRVPKNSIKAAHVEKFENYTEDFMRFLKNLDESGKTAKKRPFIIAHSTGSLVISSALPEIREKLPHWSPKKIVFWTPYIKLKVTPLLNNFVVRPLIAGIDWFASKLGILIMGKKFVIQNFEENRLTSNREFFEWSERIRRGNGWASSGVTLKWVLESMKVSNQFLKDHYQQIKVPCLIFTAENDHVVDNDWKLENSHIEVREIKGALHALHMERREIFDKAIRESFDFFLPGW